MIWNDTRIKEWASNGGVTPYDETLVNPASLDLRLGNQIRVPQLRWTIGNDSPVGRETPASELWTDSEKFDTFILKPGRFVLCHSLEYTFLPTDAAAQLISKSSTGRIGLEHLHSGWGDPTFHGQWTWEFHNSAPWPIKLVAGQPYMQLVVMGMSAVPERSYLMTGRYNGQVGATPHRTDRGVIGGSGDNR